MSTTPRDDASGHATTRPDTVWSRPYLTTTIGAFAMIVLVAFESMAVTTVMPEVSTALDGRSLYATAFAAPFASGVVGMVISGIWSDRRGPGGPAPATLGTPQGSGADSGSPPKVHACRVAPDNRLRRKEDR